MILKKIETILQTKLSYLPMKLNVKTKLFKQELMSLLKKNKMDNNDLKNGVVEMAGNIFIRQ